MTELDFDVIRLDAMPVRFQRIIDPRLGDFVRSNLFWRTYREEVLDRLVYQLNTYLLGEKLGEQKVTRVARFTHNVVYPKTWWQHFKQDVLKRYRWTRWYVRRWPVVNEHVHKFDQAKLEVDLRQYATFPAADLIMTPETIHNGIVIRHLTYDTYFKEHA